MPCDHGTTKDGASFIICSRGRRRRCGEAGCRDWSTRLCDYALTGARAGKTCDRALCHRHAHRIDDVTRISGGLRMADTVDYCPTHFHLTNAKLVAPPSNDDAASPQLSFGEPRRPPPAAASRPKTSGELARELLHNLDTLGSAT